MAVARALILPRMRCARHHGGMRKQRDEPPAERTQPPSDAPDEQGGTTEETPQAPVEPIDGVEPIEEPAAPLTSDAAISPGVPQHVRIGGQQGVRVTQAGPTRVRRMGGGVADDPPDEA